ncbi:hypothetical protein NLI96_g10979 [Meripilus lineatus]|uniref:Hemolytic lectin LSLb n=1 Tax=Meripilus lineatus TaxID=2056292 RepID=A0AAD5UU76_9APHY|nr:hypothetical protein NLI96_g10979 [Physisporinus lineatus]
MSTQDLYIPPEGIFFRLLGYRSQNVIFSRTAQQPFFGQVPAHTSDWDDQYWTLVHGTGSRAGTFAIRSKVTGLMLFSRRPTPNVGHVDGNGRFPDNWFILEPGRGQHANNFRVVTPSDGVTLVSRTHERPYLWSYDRFSTIWPDQFFSFLWEDMRVDRVDYDLHLAQVLSSTPLVIANQTLTNDTNLEQEMSFELNESVQNTSTFEYSTGFTVTVGTSFSVGIPFIARTEITVDTSTTNEWSWGQQDTFGRAHTANFPVRAGPRETVRAVSSVNRGVLEVPFTMHLSSRSTGTRVVTRGKWHGVSTWDLRHTIYYPTNSTSREVSPTISSKL